MLKFLQDRTHQKPGRSPIRYKPQMIYGISVESPTNFQTPYTIINNQTYVNPYLTIQQSRLDKLQGRKRVQAKPQWIKKTNLQMVQEQKIISSHIENPENFPTSRYRKSYHEQLDKSNERFKMTRGEFTDFVDKNKRYQSLAPLHGIERTNQRILNTKKSVWEKPGHISSDGAASMLYSSYYNMMRKSSMHLDSLLRNQSSWQLLSQKRRIRNNRQKMSTIFQKNYEDRKHSLDLKIQLPKLHLSTKTNMKDQKSDEEESLVALDQFEQKLKKQQK